MKLALRPLRFLFGDLAACDFGPEKLKSLQSHRIEKLGR